MQLGVAAAWCLESLRGVAEQMEAQSFLLETPREPQEDSWVSVRPLFSHRAPRLLAHKGRSLLQEGGSGGWKSRGSARPLEKQPQQQKIAQMSLILHGQAPGNTQDASGAGACTSPHPRRPRHCAKDLLCVSSETGNFPRAASGSHCISQSLIAGVQWLLSELMNERMKGGHGTKSTCFHEGSVNTRSATIEI